jgi:hypothetical protein
MSTRSRPWIWTLAIAAATAASGAAGISPGPQSTDTPAPFRVLFIGNSLTAANDLPAIVESLSRARGRRTVAATAVTANNFSLEDHWNQGNARAAIARGGWSVVVLQQGPSALPESRVLLRDYSGRFAAEATRVGARTALYMVWPSKQRVRDYDEVSESYALAARDVGATLLAAGDAWREAWRREPALALYAEDGFHASALGSYLAALAIWRGLSGESVVGLPGPRGVSTGTLGLLQEAADQTAVTPSPSKEFSGPR